MQLNILVRDLKCWTKNERCYSTLDASDQPTYQVCAYCFRFCCSHTRIKQISHNVALLATSMVYGILRPSKTGSLNEHVQASSEVKYACTRPSIFKKFVYADRRLGRYSANVQVRLSLCLALPYVISSRVVKKPPLYISEQ